MYPRLAQENNACEFEPWSLFQKHLSILRKIFGNISFSVAIFSGLVLGNEL